MPELFQKTTWYTNKELVLKAKDEELGNLVQHLSQIWKPNDRSNRFLTFELAKTSNKYEFGLSNKYVQVLVSTINKRILNSYIQ